MSEFLAYDPNYLKDLNNRNNELSCYLSKPTCQLYIKELALENSKREG